MQTKRYMRLVLAHGTNVQSLARERAATPKFDVIARKLTTSQGALRTLNDTVLGLPREALNAPGSICKKPGRGAALARH